MARGLYFMKRSGGDAVNFWRCGCCGADTDANTSRGNNLMLGNRLMGLICDGCKREVSERLSALYAVRSFPDLDNQGNLLGDF